MNKDAAVFVWFNFFQALKFASLLEVVRFREPDLN
jgi:hypothetical protein